MKKNHILSVSRIDSLIDEFISTVLSIPFCSYHFFLLRFCPRTANSSYPWLSRGQLRWWLFFTCQQHSVTGKFLVAFLMLLTLFHSLYSLNIISFNVVNVLKLIN